ncbi:hypothetical protein CGCSCA4_v012890 [Colletotrichum siamense]|uniref:Protein kinase domain-containing protein n=1 Tax=Colletotrichum siamense TaxID=690259 RepID=A0A9P5BSU0_COLSI|nr:hypothetical protein CGCSCA4_v012890 [Colletotrichum siamense]KAF4848705.1 hypothetical protein CGCSCA2_v012251 [Colletotrichum siamense]
MSSTSTVRVLDSTALERFDPGEELVLTPYPLSDPCNIGFEDEGRAPSDFDPSQADGKLIEEANPATKARLVIKKRLSGASANGQKVLLCRVEQAPTAVEMNNAHANHLSEANLVIVKTFASIPRYEWVPDGYRSHEHASSEPNSEAAVYQHLYDNGLTGYPHLAPQYYGTWVFEKEQKGQNACARDRYTSLIVMEYIHGVSIEQLGTRNWDRDNYGPLQLSTTPIALYRNSDKTLPMDTESRLRIFKTLLDGVVRKLHAGIFVDRMGLAPRKVLVSLRNNGKELEEPRIVSVGYYMDKVWSRTKEGRDSGKPMIAQQLDRPPHPALYFPAISEVSDFQGWFPREWCIYDSDQFHGWLLSESGFGPLDGNEKYSNLPDEDAECLGLSMFPAF